MRTALDQTLSGGIDRLRKDVNDALAGTIMVAAFDAQLGILQKMANNLERELSILRQTEAGREMRTHIEQTATDALADMLPSEGKVIRPDFGRKS